MTEQSRPKPIELVARAIDPTTWENWDNWIAMKGYTPEEAAEEFARSLSLHKSLSRAEDAFDILIKHGCISIEGIIARDEELARVAPVPERAGET
jgi:hypothetical protein